MAVGDWINFGPLIIEITAITQTDVIGRKVEYKSEDPQLRYGETVCLRKSYFKIGGTNNDM